tara:strand:+ start:1093 stop:2496 length:1404 start_codon:yes stop_codon:yes gene_type:complete
MNKTLDNQELLKIINELENTLDISALNLKDLNIWPLIRISICFGLIAIRYDTKTFVKAKRSKNIFSIFKDFWYFKEFISKEPKIRTIHATHDLYLFKINNKIYDRVHFGYEQNDDENYSAIKRINLSDLSLRSIKNDLSIIHFPSIFLLLKIISIPYSIIIFFRNLKTFKNLFNVYRFFNNRGINTTSIFFKIPFKLSYILLLSKFMKYFFEKCETKLLRHANYYSLESMALTLAARRCNVTVENIQHGSQSNDHPAFGGWNKVPSDGYDLLPSVFSCWDEESVKVLNRSFNSIKKHRTRLSKYFWVDAWKNNEISYNFNEIKANSNQKYNILLTLQPSINGIQDFVSECIEKSSKDVCWWIRLHPRQLTKQSISNIKESLPKTSSKISIETASFSPLPALLAVSDLHITAFSSSIYEASYFNIPTIVTHKMGFDYYGQNFKTLNAIYCEDSNSILENIKNGVDRKF